MNFPLELNDVSIENLDASPPPLGTKTERETERERRKLEFLALFFLHSRSHFHSILSKEYPNSPKQMNSRGNFCID
jgi:hypothetical protein